MSELPPSSNPEDTSQLEPQPLEGVGAARLLTVGDIHGEYTKWVALMQRLSLLDARAKWAGGNSRVVLVGDYVDRGRQGLSVLRAIRRLETEALEAGGKLVALMGNPGQANYVASKAGLIGLTKALAKEYGTRGITVNAVAPGFIESDMTAELSAEVKAKYLEQIPVGRFGTPEEVAALVRFLVSDEAAYISGQVISVNGGMYLP